MATLTTLFKIGADISDLQAGMTKAVASIDAMEKNTSRVTTTLNSMGKAIAGAFTVTAVIGAAKSLANFAMDAAESAGAILDLSSKTGLTTDTIQQMGFVAKQVGSDVETFARAAFMLGVNVEKGEGQIKNLGLSFE